jgi:hypothetical protein
MSTASSTPIAASPPPAQQILAVEQAAYERELPGLLADGEEGHWVLIQGNAVAGVWDTFADAVQAGDERFGLTPFLVQKVSAEPRSVRITRAFP